MEERPGVFIEISIELAEAVLPWHLYIDSFATHITITGIDMRVIGQLRCAETALAVERFRLKYEALPESLEDLEPEFMAAVPLEPFDGESLRYILHEDGYTVYTIGDDWEDNDGLSKDEMAEMTGEESPEEYDWPFTVRRAVDLLPQRARRTQRGVL